MDEAIVELTREWLVKADHDLKNASIVSRAPQGPLDTAIYHCQQAVEKALKGWLCWKGVAFERTHDLRRLINLAATTDPAFSRYQSSADILTPYASIFRYPGLSGDPTPSREEFDEAMNHALGTYNFVLSLLPTHVRPA
ncbi:MAG: HEPN domain-containing protein [Acidobacteria bacterium]|nr:HEPN domain-containing protein [Acidobacteriota bacterium]